MLGQAFVVTSFLMAQAAAEPLPPGLTMAEMAVVREAIDGDTLHLADGRIVRLAAVAAPKPPLSPSTTQSRDKGLDELATAARRALDDWTRGRAIALYPVAPSDRHGRLVAHVVAPARGWLQRALVAEGLARIEFVDAAGATLLRTEAAARAERRGLWAHPLFQIRRPEDSGRWLDTFQLIEGRISAVRGGRGRDRLEVGTGERRLTVIIPAKLRAELRALGGDPSALLGRDVRVRGWIRWQDGARLELTHAAALEYSEP